MRKTAQELYDERLKRVHDAIALRVPDRVPLIPVIEAFPMYYSGITIQEAMNSYDKAATAYDKFFEDFDPDLAWDPIFMYPAHILKLLDLKWFRWPGHGVEANRIYQFVEGEFMKADEYEELIHDPTNYIQSKILPRHFGSLKGLSQLAPIRNSIWLGWFSSFTSFASEELQEALEVMKKAGEELNKWLAFLGNYQKKMREKWGLPIAYGSFSFAPFDLIGDTLRGTVPVMTDIIRRPELLLKAIDVMTPIAIDMGVRGARATGIPFVYIWLHKGVDEFMSDEQYKTFYWPSLKKLLEALIDEGLIPMVYGEGSMNNRLEDMRNVPKGKLVYHFETVDMARAKDILGDIACICGNVPNSLLCTGTPDEVKEYCKKLIDTCGKNGGFMMDTGALIDEAKPENLKAMFEITKEYGTY